MSLRRRFTPSAECEKTEGLKIRDLYEKDGTEFTRDVLRARKGRPVKNEYLEELAAMKVTNCSWEELQDMPEEIVIAFTRIESIISRREMIETKLKENNLR